MLVGLVSKSCTGLMLDIVLDRIYGLTCVFFVLLSLFILSSSVNYSGISYDWGCFPLLVSIDFLFFSFLLLELISVSLCGTLWSYVDND